MNKPFVRIVEQPASKALRFRYQCEGRSAGSIPGANSTSEVKSYPSIQVCGYKGPAVVLVSCVTKDAPYRPHPHNLVGREGCKGGVCTLQIPPDTMSMTFSNLGIQCVKKRDIADNLDARHKYKVDPFNTGFDHKNQPTSIDLNAVRLCFQVYITNPAKGDNKFSVPLAPVVSDPIYDKKAMCDLTIVKLSDCSSIVDGGKKDIILLCEKVTKEDIEIRFFEEIDGQITWEGKGDFQPSQVHKQTAIWFRAPRYKTLDIIEPVRVNIQLRRPSDGAVSEALPFEMLPLDSGRPSFWSTRRNYKKAHAYELFNSALASDAEAIRKRQLSNLEKLVASVEKTNVPASPEPEYGEIKKSKMSPRQKSPPVEPKPPTNDKVEIIEVVQVQVNNNTITDVTDTNVDVEMTHNYEPIEQPQNHDEICTEEDVIREVVELDEIYTENQKRIAEIDAQTKLAPPLGDPLLEQESFDDAKTYSSLQMAFKNPMQLVELDIDLNDKYEDVIVNPNAPIIDVHQKQQQIIQVDVEPMVSKPQEEIIEVLPPLPPKRSRKVIETDIDDPGVGTVVETIPLSSQEAVNVLCTTSTTPISLSRSQSMLSRSQNDLAPVKALPPKPTSYNTSTLPNPKKRGFFSKLFGRKQDPIISSQHSLSKRGSVSSFASSNKLQVSNVSLNRTPSNASNKSQLSYRVPLKDSSNDQNDLNNLNLSRKDVHQDVHDLNINNIVNNNNDNIERESNVSLGFDGARGVEDDDFNMNLDLTEAEHYALYTAMAPHATQSEFDEMSAYYAPVEGGKVFPSGHAKT